MSHEHTDADRGMHDPPPSFSDWIGLALALTTLGGVILALMTSDSWL